MTREQFDRQFIAQHPEYAAQYAEQNKRDYTLFNKGSAAAAQGNYAEALKYWVAGSDDLPMNAFLAGKLYEFGDKEGKYPPNYQEAMRFYLKAAARRNESAMYRISLLYAYGKGTPIDLKQAEIWMRKAAALNEPLAGEWVYAKAHDTSLPPGMFEITATERAKLNVIESRDRESKMLASQGASHQPQTNALEPPSVTYPTSEQDRTKYRAALDGIVLKDSKGWASHKYDAGSMNGIETVAKESNGGVTIRGQYTYNQGQPGWVEVQFDRGKLGCLRYWNFSDTCRPQNDVEKMQAEQAARDRQAKAEWDALTPAQQQARLAAAHRAASTPSPATDTGPDFGSMLGNHLLGTSNFDITSPFNQ